MNENNINRSSLQYNNEDSINNHAYNEIKLSLLISSLCGGGAEKIATELYTNLPIDIERVLVKLYDVDNRDERFTVKDSIYLSKYYSNDLIRTFNLLIILVRYIRFLKLNNIPVSMSFLPTDNILNIIACIFTNTIPIISFHLSPSYRFGRYINVISTLSMLLYKITKTQIISVSRGIKDELINRYGLSDNKISMIHNPINLNRITKLSNESIINLKFNEDKMKIISVGRLEAEKGYWHLLRVFAEIRNKFQCELLICGEGSLVNYIETLAVSLNIDDSVILLGWQENPYKYISRSTVFVQSSLSEALPNVLVESMACGCPAVAADCSSGIHEIMGDDNSCGIICAAQTGIRHSADEPLDSGEISLYNAIMTILHNPELRESMSQAAMERAKIFDMDIGIQKYVDLIDSVSNKYRRCS